jgi:RNA polymerase sigma-70 factor (ECF subfamily)
MENHLAGITILHGDQDHLLLERIREGDARSFNILYERYWQQVYTSAIKRLKNHAQAQDITQDIFVKLWQNKEVLQIDNLPGYLYTAVRNRVLNLFEKQRRYIPFEQLFHDKTRSSGEQADAAALHHEFLNAYRDLVNSMPDKRKKIFHYYYDEGLSTADIALKLDISRKTVQNQLGRAVTFLKSGLSHLFVLMILLCNL